MSGLWGELETSENVTATLREDEQKPKSCTPNEDEEFESDIEDESSDILNSVINSAVKSNGFFRHQQVGEDDLNHKEKEDVIKQLLSHKPAVFLQRFGKYLSEEQLDYFEHISESNFEVQFYLNEARQFGCRKVRQQRVKNRRYAMLQRMLQASHPHFSESAMKERNPLLYEQLVGRFKTKEEKSRDDAVDMTNCSLTNIILEHMDINKERDDKKRMEKEEAEEEFDTDDDEDGDDKDVARLKGGREFLKQEFINAAYQSFLAGKDSEVDYHAIDTDVALDDLEAEEQEMQEKYFDESDFDE